MSHLNLEELARLVDEPPAAGEAEHIAACAICTGSLLELREQSAVLAALPPVAAPRNEWAHIERRLASSPVMRIRRMQTPQWRSRASRAALWMLIGATAQAAILALMFAGPPQVGSFRSAWHFAWMPKFGTNPVTAPEAPVVAPVSDSAQIELAKLKVDEAAANYFEALTDYSTISGGVPIDPEARLATFESIVAVTGVALERAPTDPLINGYHLSALAERDALLKQATLVPSGASPWY
jgi:hypothetical protein